MSNRKQLLCKIARREGELGLRATSHQAGPQIEKYLAVFRPALYEISQEARFLDLTQGYDWCCAFVYYCCQQAGYQIPIRASPDAHYTLAAVKNWVEYARIQNIWQDRKETDYLPNAGDLVVFHQLLSQDLMGHIGIVLHYDAKKKVIETAEGNMHQATGIFKRSTTGEAIKGYICLPI